MRSHLLALTAVGALALSSSGLAAERLLLNVDVSSGVLDVVFVDRTDGVTRQSVDPSVAQFVDVPPETRDVYVHRAFDCWHMCGTGVASNFSAALLEDPVSGMSLQVAYPAGAATAPLAVGQMINIVDGITSVLPGAEVREPGISFIDISDTQFADTSVFPLFTGMAEVVGFLDYDIRAVCDCEIDGDYANVTVFDLLAYLQLWFAQDAAAELDGQPGIGVFDLLAFLDCWFPASTAGGLCEA